VTSWLTPPGTKSSLLSQIIEKSPILLLFTPRNQMAGLAPYYDLLRETALEFYNCNSSTSVKSLIQHLILKRYALQQELNHLKEKCASYISSFQEYKSCKYCTQQCCQSIESNQFPLNKCSCVACLYSGEQKKISSKSNCDKIISKTIKHVKIPNYLLFHSCANIDFEYPLNYGSYHHISVNCHDQNFKDEFASDILYGSKSVGVQDDRVMKLLQIMEKKKCRHFYVAMNYSNVSFPNVSQVIASDWRSNFSGLGCRTNRTLSFVAMDAIEFHTFAEHLGFDILNHPHQTIVVILEAKQETQYHLEGEINKNSLG
ncbi:thioredoxin domain-containing protein 11-like, partial [Centruroides sculpturatus]|uniref:thioredoxin domain-containing protein 11-like n=1 Tax=Centruroides sculpturatus TaxID=218467 RepID=UPI000C6CD3CA